MKQVWQKVPPQNSVVNLIHATAYGSRDQHPTHTDRQPHMRTRVTATSIITKSFLVKSVIEHRIGIEKHTHHTPRIQMARLNVLTNFHCANWQLQQKIAAPSETNRLISMEKMTPFGRLPRWWALGLHRDSGSIVEFRGNASASWARFRLIEISKFIHRVNTNRLTLARSSYDPFRPHGPMNDCCSHLDRFDFIKDWFICFSFYSFSSSKRTSNAAWDGCLALDSA